MGDNYVEMRRHEREAEFAPPSIYFDNPTASQNLGSQSGKSKNDRPTDTYSCINSTGYNKNTNNRNQKNKWKNKPNENKFDEIHPNSNHPELKQFNPSGNINPKSSASSSTDTASPSHQHGNNNQGGPWNQPQEQQQLQEQQPQPNYHPPQQQQQQQLNQYCQHHQQYQQQQQQNPHFQPYYQQQEHYQQQPELFQPFQQQQHQNYQQHKNYHQQQYHHIPQQQPYQHYQQQPHQSYQQRPQQQQYHHQQKQQQLHNNEPVANVDNKTKLSDADVSNSSFSFFSVDNKRSSSNSVSLPSTPTSNSYSNPDVNYITNTNEDINEFTTPAKIRKVPKMAIVDNRFMLNSEAEQKSGMNALQSEIDVPPDIKAVPYKPGSFTEARFKHQTLSSATEESRATSIATATNSQISGGPQLYSVEQKRQQVEKMAEDDEDAQEKVEEFLKSIHDETA